ncbi:hypothetical protein OOZ63_03075 [Paucibacter sp. PLA-PC-4]|uniref:hypothetical protein n=1 Tax=Paucibacter sp. PLA-PC-4 TaxID=2993655 RepID=UPI002248ABE2|nr:hypothetical protein [Paucibacter sp. PLA-PC-4]MCX2860816.1 hypothetical protein [Paucibacter sp. PLA-PC-4]
MNRLLTELRRLYALPAAEPAEGRVRAMLLELARPADWDALGAVWRGVQADLELPAPAIAVNGIDGYQLWFSLAEPVPAAQALDFLEGLRRRYLDGIAAQRLTLAPTARDLPPRQLPSGLWSALLAPDLAPVFADEPWLDTEPGAEGQADLLCRLQPIKSADFRAALERLVPDAPVPRADAASAAPTPSAVAGQDAPRRFLLGVMNDASAPLHLRIEAAKALL